MTETFDANGIRLEYEVIGAGRPFVFLHGMGGSIAQIRAVYEPLDGVKLITMNQQGHGESGVNWETFGFDRMAEDVCALLDRLGIDRAVIGGISMGAAVALNLALRYPERVEKLLLIRNAWTDKPMSPEVCRAYRDMGTALEQGGMERFCTSEGWRIVSQTSDYTRNAFTTPFRETAPLRHWQKYLILPKQAPFSSLCALKRLTAPTTVLACRNDFCHPFEYGTLLAAHIPHATFREIPDKDSDSAGQKRCINEEIRKLFEDTAQERCAENIESNRRN